MFAGKVMEGFHGMNIPEKKNFLISVLGGRNPYPGIFSTYASAGFVLRETRALKK